MIETSDASTWSGTSPAKGIEGEVEGRALRVYAEAPEVTKALEENFWKKSLPYLRYLTSLCDILSDLPSPLPRPRDFVPNLPGFTNAFPDDNPLAL